MPELYEIIEENNPILREVMPLVKSFDEALNEVSQKMVLTMTLHKGIGLAAPQCNLSLRMFVMNHQENVISCINPEIIESEEEIVCSEGCLSFPGLLLKIKRFNMIVGKYTTVQGEIVTEKFWGVEAQCFQHELDHLNGITFDKKVSNLVLNIARRKRQKQKGN